MNLVLPPVPYDEKDPSPCENCKALNEWSKRQLDLAPERWRRLRENVNQADKQ